MRVVRDRVAGQGTRRAVALAVGLLGLTDIVLAAVRHPLLRVVAHSATRHVAIVTSRYLLLTAGVLLLGATRSLWHGKHRAWQVAVALTSLSLFAHPLRRGDAAGLVPTALVLAVLLTTRRFFTARSDPSYTKQGVRWLTFGMAGVVTYGTAGLYLFDTNFREPTDLAESFREALKLLFVVPATAIDPVNRYGVWLIDSVRFFTVLVLVAGLWNLVHSVTHTGARSDRDTVEHILRTCADTPLAHFHLLDDKSQYIADDRSSFIGYRVVGSTAVALGEPIGKPDSCRAVARSFAEYCDLNGWTFAYHQVTETGAKLLADVGLRATKIGEEAVIDLGSFDLSGSHFKRTRTKNRQLSKEGVWTEMLADRIDDETMAELRRLSDAWLADGGHRERTFTLGSFDPQYLRSTDVLVARSASGRIEAFVNIVPSYNSPVGNFDLMRRRPDAPNGIMDYLLCDLAVRFEKDGKTGMTLGFAPLAGIDGDGIVPRMLRSLYEREGSTFNFKGLHKYKQKWLPNWEPRYLVYRSDLQLPQIALALARVGERHEQIPRWLRFGMHTS